MTGESLTKRSNSHISLSISTSSVSEKKSQPGFTEMPLRTASKRQKGEDHIYSIQEKQRMGHSQVTAANKTGGENKNYKRQSSSFFTISIASTFLHHIWNCYGCSHIHASGTLQSQGIDFKTLSFTKWKKPSSYPISQQPPLPNPTCSRSSAPGSTIFAACTFPIPRKYHENANI